ncbi:MAG: hypothetical protein Q8R92_13045 [Deltaproteobacteria bacterium]|nr:hypothetical protein [Deltaproteobacteria bacterium]
MTGRPMARVGRRSSCAMRSRSNPKRGPGGKKRGPLHRIRRLAEAAAYYRLGGNVQRAVKIERELDRAVRDMERVRGGKYADAAYGAEEAGREGGRIKRRRPRLRNPHLPASANKDAWAVRKAIYAGDARKALAALNRLASELDRHSVAEARMRGRNPGTRTDGRYIVMSAGSPRKGRFGNYRRVAVVRLAPGFEGVPKMISTRTRGVAEIIRVWERLSVGKTDRGAYQIALGEAQQLAAELNRG